MSEFPNVTLKLQGLALIFGSSADAVAPWVRKAAEVFGPDRCMFATHFPIDRLLWSYDELLGALLSIIGDRSPDDRQAFFSGCAERVYGLS